MGKHIKYTEADVDDIMNEIKTPEDKDKILRHYIRKKLEEESKKSDKKYDKILNLLDIK